MNLLNSKRDVDLQELPTKKNSRCSHGNRDMGFSFLWVDSLCIIQDSEKDRTQRIARMPAIYRNAVCNIAASSSASAQMSEVMVCCEIPTCFDGAFTMRPLL